MEIRQSDLTPDLFRPLDVGARESERISGRPIGFWEDSWSRLKKNRGALLSLVLIILVVRNGFSGRLASLPILALRAGLDP
jgi:oligopeptide transport system permease protein